MGRYRRVVLRNKRSGSACPIALHHPQQAVGALTSYMGVRNRHREIRKQRKAGLEQGFKQGTIQIAKKLKREMSIKDISRITGLTEQEIENL